jgi:hypothetical protein
MVGPGWEVNDILPLAPDQRSQLPMPENGELDGACHKLQSYFGLEGLKTYCQRTPVRKCRRGFAKMRSSVGAQLHVETTVSDQMRGDLQGD